MVGLSLVLIYKIINHQYKVGIGSHFYNIFKVLRRRRRGSLGISEVSGTQELKGNFNALSLCHENILYIYHVNKYIKYI